MSLEGYLTLPSSFLSPPPPPHNTRGSQLETKSAFTSDFYPQPVLAGIGTTGRTRGAALYLIQDLLLPLWSGLPAGHLVGASEVQERASITAGYLLTSFVISRDPLYYHPPALHQHPYPSIFLAFRQAARHSGLSLRPTSQLPLLFRAAPVLAPRCSAFPLLYATGS